MSLTFGNPFDPTQGEYLASLSPRYLTPEERVVERVSFSAWKRRLSFRCQLFQDTSICSLPRLA